MKSWTSAVGNGLQVVWKDNTVSKFSYAFLLDHQLLNWHSQSHQRISPSSSLPPTDSLNITHASLVDNNKYLRIEWSKSVFHPSLVPLSFLKKVDAQHDALLSLQHPWTQLKQLPSSEFSETSTSQLLLNLATFGLHLVRNTPNTMKETEQFVRSHVGPPRETLYGGMWDTAPRSDKVNDTAYTFDALDPHTDCCYLEDSPGLQIFNCVAQDEGEGGFTRLVDSAYVLKHLLAKPTFDYFATQTLRFHHTEPTSSLAAENRARAIEVDPHTHVVKQFRYNEYDLSPLNYVEDVDAFYEHNRVLIQALKAEETRIKLKPGDMLILNNHRVLHGRTKFTGYRNLIGCYVGKDDWTMRARALLSLSSSS